MTSSIRSGEQLVAIQALRALAAALVMAYHVQYDLFFRFAAASGEWLRVGAAGVDVFFVISGFIMVHTCWDRFGRPGAAGAFMARRIIRIVPLYWLATTAFVAIAVIAPAVTRRELDPAFILASYLFVPVRDHTGAFSPFYGLGWTLNYEMLFYAVFAAALLARRRTGLMVAAAAIVGLAASSGIAEDLPEPLQFWTKPIILEFLLGGVIAVAYRRGWRVSGIGGLAAIGAGAAMALWWDVSSAGEITHRAFGWGVPAALIVAGAVLRRGRREAGRIARAAAYLGDASYALYLTHLFAIAGLRIVGLKHAAFVAAWPWAYGSLVALAAIGLAIAVHELFERPVTRLLLARYARVPAAQDALSDQAPASTWAARVRGRETGGFRTT